MDRGTNGRMTPSNNSRSIPARPNSNQNSRGVAQNNARAPNSMSRTNQPNQFQQQPFGNSNVRGLNVTGVRTNATPQMGIIGAATGSNQPKPPGNQRLVQPRTQNSIFANDSQPMSMQMSNNVSNRRQQQQPQASRYLEEQRQVQQTQQRFGPQPGQQSAQPGRPNQLLQGQNSLAISRPSAPPSINIDARRRANESGIMAVQQNSTQRNSQHVAGSAFGMRQAQNSRESTGAGPGGIGVSGQQMGALSQGAASIQGSAISHTSKMPPRPVSSTRRKILAAQQAATHQLHSQQSMNSVNQPSPMNGPTLTLSPEHIRGPNGGRYLQNPTNMSANEYEQRAYQFNHGMSPRRQSDTFGSGYTPSAGSRLPNQGQFNEQEQNALLVNKTQAAREKLQTASVEQQSIHGNNFNMHPQQEKQSTTMSHNHASSGLEKTDDNNEGSAFTDNESIESSDLTAVEFAEDPIEKNKRYRGVAPQRIIPDRNKDKDQREMEYNNFMLGPWVPGQNSEDETAGSSTSRGQQAANAQVKEPEPPTKTVPQKQRPPSPKVREPMGKPPSGPPKPQAAPIVQKPPTQMQYPLWKEEEIPDLISGFEDEDFELLKDRNYDILDDTELTDNQMSYHQQARQKEEAAIAEINFENFLIRQQMEEEEQMQQNGYEESKEGQYPGQVTYDVDGRPDTSSNISPNKKSRGGKRAGKEYLKNVFSINTSYCRTELELIQHVIAKSGFAESTAGGSLYWFGLSLQDKDIKILAKKKCFYNRYPGLEYMCRKKIFCDINNRMRRTFPKLFNFSPISFLVPEEGQALQDYMQLHPKFFFIGKPSRGRGGEGIILIQKFADIPKNLSSYEERDMLVQRYVKTPLLLDGKKFDLRLYVLIKGYDPVEAYLADEGLVRVCTETYRMPNPQNMKNMFMHLTNFCLNKNSDNYKAPDENFMEEDSGSKRLLSSLWKSLEEQGYDVQLCKDKIADTVKKAVITMEPYLIHSYHQKVNQNHENTKNFQILGMDILLDKKMNAWLMEVNANPSLNMFLEKDMEPNSIVEPEKILSELDKFVKTKVAADAIRIVTGHGTDEFEGTYTQVLPEEDGSLDNYYIWNRGLELFELMIASGKATETVSNMQFSRLARVPEFAKVNQFFKADLDICFKNMQRKHDSPSLDLHAFFDSVEQLSQKIYKEEEDLETSLSYFLDAAIAFFEEQNEKAAK